MLTIPNLLDRMEILFPYNTNISDLRRAYIDQDWRSLCRFLDCDGNWSNEDLKKLMLEDNIWSLFHILTALSNSQILATVKWMHFNNLPWHTDSISRGQLKSKMWLVNELKLLDLDLGNVFLCAGWYGILATIIFEHELQIKAIRSFDIDPDVADIAEKFNAPWFKQAWKFKAITQDIHEIDYDGHTWQCWSKSNNRMSHPIMDIPDTIINTSCEHISDFDSWYVKLPIGKLLILQSNNFVEIDEHTNIATDLKEFRGQTPMTTLLFEGELQLESYTRFMRIGYR